MRAACRLAYQMLQYAGTLVRPGVCVYVCEYRMWIIEYTGIVNIYRLTLNFRGDAWRDWWVITRCHCQCRRIPITTSVPWYVTHRCTFPYILMLPHTHRLPQVVLYFSEWLCCPWYTWRHTTAARRPCAYWCDWCVDVCMCMCVCCAINIAEILMRVWIVYEV